MITSEQQAILHLLRESMGAAGAAYDPNAVTSDTANILFRNGIVLTVYPTVRKKAEEQIDAFVKLEATLRNLYFTAIRQAVLQDYEGERILEQLSASGFDCIALKGWEMRKLYPDSTMRQMADLDILVRPYRFSTIKAIMQSIGFSGDSESSWKHDGFHKDKITVEMHKRLTDDSGVVRQWEKEMWDRAVSTEGHRYRMSDEDYYVFHFVHLHKDFKNGSLGLRRIVDTWLLEQQPIDRTDAIRMLNKIGLARFREKMVHLSRVTMGEEEPDADCEILLSHAFRHGIYGTPTSYKAGRIASMSDTMGSGKVKSWIAAVFLPYKRMKAQFPILEKWPVLLPICWARRIIRTLKGDMQKSKRMMDYRSVTEADFEEMKRFFRAGGV